MHKMVEVQELETGTQSREVWHKGNRVTKVKREKAYYKLTYSNGKQDAVDAEELVTRN